MYVYFFCFFFRREKQKSKFALYVEIFHANFVALSLTFLIIDGV